MIKRFIIAMLGVVFLSIVVPASASAFTVTTTANYQKDAQGNCPAEPECRVDLTAQAQGATEPVRYDWWGDTPGQNPPSYQNQRDVVFGYQIAGEYTPTVRATDANNEVVYASPGPITVTGGFDVSFQFYAPARASSNSVITVISQQPIAFVRWRSGGTLVKAQPVPCAFGGNARCYSIAAAPKGMLTVEAKAGSKSASKQVDYYGRPVGAWQPRISAKRSGGRCRLTATLTGAAGVSYRYRGSLKVQYRKRGSQKYRNLTRRPLASSSRTGKPAYEPVFTMGKASKRLSYAGALKNLSRSGAKFRLVQSHTVKAAGKQYRPKAKSKRFNPRTCAVR